MRLWHSAVEGDAGSLLGTQRLADDRAPRWASRWLRVTARRAARLGRWSVLAPLVLVVLLAMPSAAWVAAAVVTAVAFRGLVGLRVHPRLGSVRAYTAGVGRARRGLCFATEWLVLALRTVKWLGLFAAAVVASALVNHPELIRGPVYFALLAEPFAIIAALLVDPPSAVWRRRLLRTCVVLVAVQVPICYWQATTACWGDGVQGTLYGSGAGAHVVGAIAAVGAFWYMARAERLWSPTSIAVIAALFGIVLVADASRSFSRCRLC